MAGDQSIEEQTARMVIEDIDPLTRKVHEISGQPYDIPNLTKEHQDWAWNYADPTVNVEQLRAAGMSEPEIGAQYFPLRTKLMGQAGLHFDEHRKYADHMEERRLANLQAGKVPQPPERGDPGLRGVNNG